jgi:sugar lactone lactonase YvrE
MTWEESQMHGRRRVDAVAVARGVAAVLVCVMTWYFWTSDAIRDGNPFLVPDILLTLLLVAGVALPRGAARPTLVFAFAWSAGVLSVAWFSSVVRGEFPVGHPLMILAAVLAAALLARDILSAGASTGAEPRRGEEQRASRLVRGGFSAMGVVIALWLVGASAFVMAVEPPAEPFEPEGWSVPRAVEVREELIDSDTAGEIHAFSEETVAGPEDIAVDDDGRLYTGTADGRILRISPGEDAPETFAEVDGRPLGMEFNDSGDLIVADHGIGVQSISPEGDVELLTDTAAGKPILFANDLTVAADGSVYVSDSNAAYNRSTLGERRSYSLYDFLEGRPRGRLLRHDPESQTTSVLLDGLYFPNGVVITSDQRALLVVESTRYRITRYWLEGEQAGTAEVFLDDLPGVGDGFTRDDRGFLVLAMYDRVAALDHVVLPRAWVREVAVRLPESMLLSEDDPLSGSLFVLSEEGEVLRHVTGVAPAPSNAVLHDGEWLLGTLTGDRIRVMPDVQP